MPRCDTGHSVSTTYDFIAPRCAERKSSEAGLPIAAIPWSKAALSDRESRGQGQSENGRKDNRVVPLRVRHGCNIRKDRDLPFPTLARVDPDAKKSKIGPAAAAGEEFPTTGPEYPATGRRGRMRVKRLTCPGLDCFRSGRPNVDKSAPAINLPSCMPNLRDAKTRRVLAARMPEAN